ncbi:MAG: hypothetical protein IT260_06275 [Saprospiraceae bacterium]|nr:hypothetical protein [Saprospiraceae bacterium]
MEFVINEWYLDWHRPDATPENQEKARRFFHWLQQSEHRIVVLRGSPFHQKLNDYRRDFHFDNMCKVYLKMFFSQIFENSERCRILETAPELPLHIELALQRPEIPPLTNFESDRYLFESAETTEHKIIVTTDTKLIRHFETILGLELIQADDFFSRHTIP